MSPAATAQQDGEHTKREPGSPPTLPVVSESARAGALSLCGPELAPACPSPWPRASKSVSPATLTNKAVAASRHGKARVSTPATECHRNLEHAASTMTPSRGPRLGTRARCRNHRSRLAGVRPRLEPRATGRPRRVCMRAEAEGAGLGDGWAVAARSRSTHSARALLMGVQQRVGLGRTGQECLQPGSAPVRVLWSTRGGGAKRRAGASTCRSTTRMVRTPRQCS